MLPVFLFLLAIIFTVGHLAYKKTWHGHKVPEVFLSYLLLLNVGVMGLLAAYAHVFMGPEIAKQIGWQPGSPFQFEMGMTNLSYGILGVMAFWVTGRFWAATIIGWSILLLGCFVGHVSDYVVHHNDAPLNYGIYIWFNDLILPLLVSAVFAYFRVLKRKHLAISK